MNAPGSLGAGWSVPERVALVGMGVTNRAVARALVTRGHTVEALDDGGSAGSDLAAELGFKFHSDASPEVLRSILERSGAFIATPGLPDSHRVFALAAQTGTPSLSEFDLAAAWDHRDLLAVTGTNGKTTVAMLTEAMLERSGVPSAAVGNLDVPLVSAIDDPRPCCFVVEASSFRLARSARFAPRVGTWLNFAPDHLDVHRDLDTYKRAKERIWSAQGADDVAVYNADDPVIAAAVRTTGILAGSVVSFGLDRSTEGVPDYHERDGWLVGPGGLKLVEVSGLWSALPHDRRNVLAAAATAIAGGATVEGVAGAARSFEGLAHRVQAVAEIDGIRYLDDSKATTPHATLSALEGFERVVLIAGGRNKGVDLTPLGSASNVVAVVGIGEAAEDVVAAFEAIPSAFAASMSEAVDAASGFAAPGDVVLLSPGCASFDWYDSYAQRGDDFARAVRELAGYGDADARRGS
ncbi:MAG: UDP-N-acetylmuramoyl-L-alanine--D-glutamate ligase [Microthrixaceae bacterium]